MVDPCGIDERDVPRRDPADLDDDARDQSDRAPVDDRRSAADRAAGRHRRRQHHPDARRAFAAEFPYLSVLVRRRRADARHLDAADQHDVHGHFQGRRAARRRRRSTPTALADADTDLDAPATRTPTITRPARPPGRGLLGDGTPTAMRRRRSRRRDATATRREHVRYCRPTRRRGRRRIAPPTLTVTKASTRRSTATGTATPTPHGNEVRPLAAPTRQARRPGHRRSTATRERRRRRARRRRPGRRRERHGDGTFTRTARPRSCPGGDGHRADFRPRLGRHGHDDHRLELRFGRHRQDRRRRGDRRVGSREHPRRWPPCRRWRPGHSTTSRSRTRAC